jgi:hypothetical protein
LFQKDGFSSNREKCDWKLYLQNKRKNKTIELESATIIFPPKSEHPLMRGLSSNPNFLDIPKLINAFIESNNLYIFLYIDRSLYLYQYDFPNEMTYNKKKWPLTEPFIGSLENFAGYSFGIQNKKVAGIYCFDIYYGRDVGGKVNKLFSLNINNNNLKNILFSDNSKKIKDEQKFFRELDLEQNKEKVSGEIKRILIQNHLLKQDQRFDYVGYIDDFSSYHSNKNNKRRSTGEIYFFYSLNRQTTIIRYSNDENKWLIGDYKEEEIKQE